MFDFGAISRPVFALGAVAALSACSSTVSSTAGYAPGSITEIRYTAKPDGSSGQVRAPALDRPRGRTFDYASIYAARMDGDIPIKAFDYTRMNSRYLRKEVPYFGPEKPGSIVIDANRKLLYLVQDNGMAMRYGIAVGKEGFGWTGNATLQWKQKWPTWTPPAEMIKRKPELKKYADGLKGSPANPLGARAMYLFKNGKDTMYRIHGTDKPYSIGKAASSGCFRMINQDVIDLYSRISRKNRVYVRTKLSDRVALVNEERG